jgi:Ca2+-transporting ATPase
LEPHRQTVDGLLSALGSDAQFGLSQKQVRERLVRYGKNELTTTKPVSAWWRLFKQFTNVLVVLLLVAALISAGLWLYERESALPYEALAIVAIVILNALMGYFQQARAEQAVAELRRMSAAHANVIRDGVQQSIPATALVPGDIILLEEGDTAPADARLIESISLQMAEAPLTGESVPVAKDVAVIAGEVGLGDRFSGTAATYGHGHAVITATGMRTQWGASPACWRKCRTKSRPCKRNSTASANCSG